jgi:hypothetical protein
MNRFELHCHSRHSISNVPLDGMEDPVDIVRRAKRAGLAGVAITDHDNNRGWKEAGREAGKEGIVFIPGIEVSTGHGHILALGVTGMISSGLGIGETVDRIHEKAGIAVAAHPFDIRGYGCKDFLVETDAVETFNALSVDRFSNWLSKAKAKGAGMPAVSGSDAHTLSMIGRAAVESDAHDLDSLLKAIRKGRVVPGNEYVRLDEMKEWNRLRMINAYMHVLRYIDSRYGRVRGWALKQMMRKFVLSKSQVWDIVARFALVSVIAYSGVRAIGYY